MTLISEMTFLRLESSELDEARLELDEGSPVIRTFWVFSNVSSCEVTREISNQNNLKQNN